MPETAKRIRPSLQYFSKFVEYIDGNLTFDVNSNIVERSLEAQQERYFKRMADTELSDPHANLPTDVIGDEDHEKALGEIFTHNYPNGRILQFHGHFAPKHTFGIILRVSCFLVTFELIPPMGQR